MRALKEMAMLLRARGESEYRARAYDTAASRLSQVQGDLGELVRHRRLTELPGIGDALAARITELATTGRSEYLEELRKELPPGIGELLRVPELGTKKAIALWKAIGVADLDSLERALREGRVRHVPGFGEKTEQKLLAGVEKVRSEPPPRDVRRLGDVLPRLEALIASLREAKAVTRGEVAGGARRACEELEDARIVVAARSAKKVFERLENSPLVARLSRRDPSSATVHLFDHDVVAEVHCAPEERFGAALIFATGSQEHVSRLVAVAEQKGLALTDQGLFRGEALVTAAQEAELYGALGLPFIPPELREDGSEVDLARAGALPLELITLEDVAGVVHSHSTWSDGTATLEEMARAAMAQGFRYLTVTEHSPTASYAGGLKLEDLRRQWAEIDRLNEELAPFRLLKGIESDILRDGSLDYPDAVLAKLDVVIGSIHNRHALGEREMTDRILRAMDNPHLHILGHLTGRLLQRRPPTALKVDEILDKAVERGVALEINGSPHRLDLHAGHARKALDRGLKLAVSADSHSVRELGNTRYAVLTGRRAGLRREQTLNTLEADAFVAALRANRRQ